MQSDREFWENDYYKNLQESEKDFLKDTFLSKYEELISKVEPKRVLDLGCGLGQDTKWLRGRGLKVTACDFAKQAVQQVQQICPEAEAIVLDMREGLPFKNGSFGLVNANLSLHYFSIDETAKIWAEIYRILAPGGKLIGVVNSARNGYANDGYVASPDDKNFYYNPQRKQHKRLFDQNQFDYLAQQALWKIRVLRENEIARKERKKYTWEFAWEK